MTTYILRLFFWTEEDGEKDVDLVAQYRIHAVDTDAACVVAATVLDNEPLLDFRDTEEVSRIEIELDPEQSAEA